MRQPGHCKLLVPLTDKCQPLPAYSNRSLWLAGGVATETPLQKVDLPDGSSNAKSAAYAATVQLPLDSGMVGALSFVIHAPGGRWVACNKANTRQDFFFSLSPVSPSSSQNGS